MLNRLFALETFGIKLGLENIRELCDALGHPQRSFLSLHVAGTNGKGSVTAMVHAALVAAGIRAARYTSPHLVRLNERFVVGNEMVDDEMLESVANHVLDAIDRPPTFFEATTAMAFEIFRRSHVEVAVIEVGLGGRFDATNVLEPPVGAITSIALDHEQHLGRTLEQIAFEKAGIIKPGMTIVGGALPDAAMQVVREVALQRGARLVDAAQDARMTSEMEDGRARITIETAADTYGPARLGLRGEHQIGNAVVAATLLEAARSHGVNVPAAAVTRGLEDVEWPARLELLSLANGSRVLLDAAHNPEGARALRTYLARWHPERPSLLVSIMRDKDVDAILRELLPVTSSVIATAAKTPRAMPANELASRVRALDATRAVVACEDASAAIDAAVARSATVCVAGSIFMAGEVRERLCTLPR
ncbi:MAG: bifunctional folylpolyglutamate synthase/dihydrofolate synthase [Acidobacteria bacterium]|nr:MAG: bifunctional folylpolyglutamate synthase/dihydrofolate synthase [Acidobacteriota bacterium]